jgi:hypothetical protein
MSDEWVSSLTPSQKEVLLVRALAELRKSRDRLNQTPSNSSKPPSSRAPWESTRTDAAVAPTNAAPTVFDVDAATPSAASGPTTSAPSTKTPSGKAGAKKAGKQVGAKGFGRTQKLAYTQATPHHPDSCAGCGQPLSHDGAVAYTAWDDIDIAEKVAGQAGLFLQVTRHTLHACSCSCGHVTRAAHHVAPEDPFWDKVALGQWRLIGPRLAGAIVFLALRMRLSRARIREFFIELFDLQLSTGVLDETIREAGRAVAPLEDEMVLDIEEAVLLHADRALACLDRRRHHRRRHPGPHHAAQPLLHADRRFAARRTTKKRQKGDKYHPNVTAAIRI